MESFAPWVFVAVATVGTVAYAVLRRRRERRDTAALAKAIETGLHVPQTLHPVIDPDVCIGCLSCVIACPEGEIIGVVDGAARLISGANCIGHGVCQVECPTGALKLVMGTSERGVDLPEVDETFESSRPGVHVIGELSGMGLIRNALLQGVELPDHLAARLAAPDGRAPVDGAVDVAIVGAGPAGLAAALACRARNLSFRVLEQDALGGAIANYPRHKVVMMETVELPLYGRFGRRLIVKEDLLAEFEKACRKGAILVEQGTRVDGLAGEDGRFVVQTNRGPVPARKVVLAVGRRGTPRKLGVPGEALDKVTYGLVDPEQYDGARVLVVGGGDAALEAAIQLAGHSDALVALSYRGEAFGRCREANRTKALALAEAGRISLLFKSQVEEIGSEAVTLRVDGGLCELPNDYVIVCAGGELPLAFLEKVGVRVKRHHGTAMELPLAGGRRRAAGEPRGSSPKELRARRHRRFAWALVAAGIAIVAALSALGWDYYLLSSSARLLSPDHEALRPAGSWGHGVGIVATLFMLSNFIYPLRKRWRAMKGSAPIESWLTFHVFVGFMSPVVILFHAAFRSGNTVAKATYGALVVVVLTGVVGRFLYSLVPSRGGVALEQAEFQAHFERLRHRLGALVSGAGGAGPLHALLEEAARLPTVRSLPALFVRMPLEHLGLRLGLHRARRLFADADQFSEFRGELLRLLRLRNQVRFFRSFKRLLSAWRIVHVVLALLLVVAIGVHVAFTFYLGYRWILQ